MEGVCSFSSWMRVNVSACQLRKRSSRNVTFDLHAVEDESSNSSEVTSQETSSSGRLEAESAFQRAAAYRNRLSKSSKETTPSQPPQGSRAESALKKAAEYRKSFAKPAQVESTQSQEALEVEKALQDAEKEDKEGETDTQNTWENNVKLEPKPPKEEEKRGRDMEVEIVTRDGVIKRKVAKPEESFTVEIKKKGIEFLGLDFNEKKKGGGTPAGLVAEFEAPRQLPDVEIITRDASPKQTEPSKPSKPSKPSSESNQLYKPKVSTWGVFPRPSNISRTYGGGRTIKPGEQLETEEERQASEARTRQLLAEYKKKMGLDIDPAVALECQQVMERGEGLVRTGRLREALKVFDDILEKMIFQSELHGQAALAKGLCLESLNRSKEARGIYEKLRSHSNIKIRKRAKELIYSFEAAEKLKFTGSSTWDSSAYRQYFELIPRKYRTYNTSYKATDDESPDTSLAEALPYMALLVVPVLFVFLIAAMKK